MQPFWAGKSVQCFAGIGSKSCLCLQVLPALCGGYGGQNDPRSAAAVSCAAGGMRRRGSWVQQRLPEVCFVPGQYSSDNAIGVAILAAQEAGLWQM